MPPTLDYTMRRCHEGMGTRLLVVALVMLSVPALLPAEVAAEDVEVSSTFLTFFKNGGGYIEYTISGEAASELRHMIDDPSVMFPFETRTADGDGVVDQSEGESYLGNLDDILTRRIIVLRGMKMENVDVDEHRGLIGSKVNDTRELYLHITFRGGIQYDKMEFNVSGLEPLAVLYGSYEQIPTKLTVDERMYIVSAGMGAYETKIKEGGTLLNLRAPLAAVVTYHGSYTVSSAPAARMEYDQNTMVGNPLILMIFMLLVTVLSIKLPKAVAKENDKERVRELHLGILVATVLVWLFYTLGGNAYLVWFLGIALTVGSYTMAHQVYVRNWRRMAIDLDGIDLGEAISAVDPVNGRVPPSGPVAQGPAILGDGRTGVEVHPSEDVVVVLPEQEDLLPVDPSHAGTGPPIAPAYIVPEPVASALVQPVEQAQVATKSMRCKCGGIFKVPLQPRPLEVQCPHCGTTGTLRT